MRPFKCGLQKSSDRWGQSMGKAKRGWQLPNQRILSGRNPGKGDTGASHETGVLPANHAERGGRSGATHQPTPGARPPESTRWQFLRSERKGGWQHVNGQGDDNSVTRSGPNIQAEWRVVKGGVARMSQIGLPNSPKSQISPSTPVSQISRIRAGIARLGIERNGGRLVANPQISQILEAGARERCRPAGFAPEVGVLQFPGVAARAAAASPGSLENRAPPLGTLVTREWAAPPFPLLSLHYDLSSFPNTPAPRHRLIASAESG